MDSIIRFSICFQCCHQIEMPDFMAHALSALLSIRKAAEIVD